jgi:hypothetical protein
MLFDREGYHSADCPAGKSVFRLSSPFCKNIPVHF